MAFAKKEGFDPLKAENWTETTNKLTEYGVLECLACLFLYSYLFN